MKSANSGRKYRKDTLLAHLGRHPEAQNGAVNPPVYHASTILSANMTEWEAKRDPSTRFDIVRYGLLGTPTTFALEEAVAAIEGGYRGMLMSSGLAAITAPLQACLKCGDQVHRRPFRRHPRSGHHQRRDVPAGAHDGGRSRPLRGPR